MNALVRLIRERGYHAIIVGEISERANAGRSSFCHHFDRRLAACFDPNTFQIPLPILARSIATTWSGLIFWWLQTRNDYTPQNIATYGHQLMRAMVRDALQEV